MKTFSYDRKTQLRNECKVFLIDYNGVIKGEGVGLTNTRELLGILLADFIVIGCGDFVSFKEKDLLKL